jgi:hypothetical protein
MPDTVSEITSDSPPCSARAPGVLCIGTVPLRVDRGEREACGGILDALETLDRGHLGAREAELGRQNAVDRVLLARIAELGEVEVEGLFRFSCSSASCSPDPS